MVKRFISHLPDFRKPLLFHNKSAEGLFPHPGRNKYLVILNENNKRTNKIRQTMTVTYLAFVSGESF